MGLSVGVVGSGFALGEKEFESWLCVMGRRATVHRGGAGGAQAKNQKLSVSVVGSFETHHPFWTSGPRLLKRLLYGVSRTRSLTDFYQISKLPHSGQDSDRHSLFLPSVEVDIER